jgi:hypothetical protein
MDTERYTREAGIAGETSGNTVELSILVISRTATNMSRLLKSIQDNGITTQYEVLCSWNSEPGEPGAEAIHIPEGMSFRIIEQRPYHFAGNNNALAKLAKGE